MADFNEFLSQGRSNEHVSLRLSTAAIGAIELGTQRHV